MDQTRPDDCCFASVTVPSRVESVRLAASFLVQAAKNMHVPRADDSLFELAIVEALIWRDRKSGRRNVLGGNTLRTQRADDCLLAACILSPRSGRRRSARFDGERNHRTIGDNGCLALGGRHNLKRRGRDYRWSLPLYTREWCEHHQRGQSEQSCAQAMCCPG